MNLGKPLLTTEDVATYLNVDVVTVRRLVSRNELAAYRIGGEYRFALEDVRDYLNRQRIPAHAAGKERTDRADTAVEPLPFPLPQLAYATFTPPAQYVLRTAVEEARQFNHPHVGTEHLLLGLVRDAEGVAGKVLHALGMNHAQVRSAVEFLVGHGGGSSIGPPLQLTVSAREALDYALEEARKLDQQDIGTEHLLLGLIRPEEGIEAGVFEVLGVDAAVVRTVILRELGQAGEQ